MKMILGLGWLVLMFAMTAAYPGCQSAHNHPQESSDPSAENVEDSTESAERLPTTTVAFMEDHHDFGMIKEGQKVTHVFRYKNTGQYPLRTENVKASCGCTAPEWSRGDVAPGQEGIVQVEFDSKGKNGIQKKNVTVTFANTDPKTKILNFTAEVVTE